MTTISERKHARFYINKNPDTFQKSRNFALRFCIQQSRHIRLRNFHEIFEIGIYIQKHDTLRYMTYIYIYKSRHFAKIKTICVTFLYIQKS